MLAQGPEHGSFRTVSETDDSLQAQGKKRVGEGFWFARPCSHQKAPLLTLLLFNVPIDLPKLPFLHSAVGPLNIRVSVFRTFCTYVCMHGDLLNKSGTVHCLRIVLLTLVAA